MAGCCNSGGCSVQPVVSARFRKALWLALWVNAGMFVIEIIGGVQVGSLSLLADAIDFAGDAANYGISLAVLSMGLALRAKAAWVKGVSMLGFGVFIAGHAVWSAIYGGMPEPVTMGMIALLALIANVGVAVLLFAFRDGDANMRSVWLCSRNDSIGNLAVLLAAFGVFGTNSHWPDLVVALIMAGLAISAGLSITRQARAELRSNFID